MVVREKDIRLGEKELKSILILPNFVENGIY